MAILMTHPLFIDIEASHADDNAFPMSISWSLPDGTLKSVIISPDSDWNPWENASPDVDIQHLLDQGVSGPDVIREINDDLDGQTVFVDGLDEDELLLELLFETYDNTLGFEIATVAQLHPQHDFEDLLLLRRQIAEDFQLNLDLAEENIQALLHLSERLEADK
ncbi:MAG: hypothetical protein ACI84K_000475 [Pseudohongiellaceae bacterium]|jgi:hypothetical protein